MLRTPKHAGTWYPADSESLRGLLGQHISQTEQHHSFTKAILVPHAGYRYCGRTSAHGYKSILTDMIRRVFVIGPCHFQFIDGCALPESSIAHYGTPLGPLPLDVHVLNELRSQSEAPFKVLNKADDEEEHSIEMQLPFIKHVFGDKEVSLVPIYVGSLGQNEERLYGRVLAKYFDDPHTLFIISSDFAHWGHRFRFSPREFPSVPSIVYPQETMNGKIESLDREAMGLISNHDCEGFSKYLQTSGNTICGKNGILILLQMLRFARTKVRPIEFNHYSQSTILPPNPSREDSCVSYASGIVTIVG